MLSKFVFCITINLIRVTKTQKAMLQKMDSIIFFLRLFKLNPNKVIGSFVFFKYKNIDIDAKINNDVVI